MTLIANNPGNIVRGARVTGPPPEGTFFKTNAFVMRSQTSS